MEMGWRQSIADRILGSPALRVLLGVGSSLIFGAVYFVAAGRWDIARGWAVVAVFAAAGVYGALGTDPDLIRERSRPGPGARDQVMVQVAKLLAVVAFVLAGLDVGRFHWSAGLPPLLSWAALGLFALGMALVLWSMAINRYFSSVVRIQTDRGHEVIAAGPYAWVRHPGYLGMLIGFSAMPLALGSWVAAVPLILYDLLILRRLMIEERVLREELAGYADYARRVRWRLVPGVW